MSRRLASSAACVLLLLARPAFAEIEPGAAPAPSLSWVRLPGAGSCIGVRALSLAVEARLGRPIFAAPAEAGLSIEGRVEAVDAAGERFRATLVVVDAEGRVLGERSLESAPDQGCRSMDDALVLVIAVTVDPEAALLLQAEAAAGGPSATSPIDALAAGEGAGGDGPASGSTGGATEPAGAEVDEPFTTEAEPEEPPRAEETPAEAEEGSPEAAHLAVDGFAGFEIGLGQLPGVPLGAALGVVVDPVGFPPIELSLGGFFAAEASQDAGGARFDQVYGRIALCVPWGLRVVQAHACAGLEAGATVVQGFDLDLPEQQVRPLVDAVAGLRLVYRPVWRLVLRAAATVVLPFFRDRYVVSDERSVQRSLFEPRVLAGVLELGVGIDLD